MTPAAESQLAWSPDSRRLVYSSERDGAPRLVLYDFTTSTETPLTAATVGDYAPQFSPDGKSIAFVRGGTELRVIDAASRQERVLAKGIIADTVGVGLPLAWSPDSRWLAYFSAGTRGFTNVSIVAAAGGEGRQVSFLANANANAITWSPDGTFLVFDTGQRTEPTALARLDLTLRTPRFREDQFRDLFNEENTPGNPPVRTAPPQPPAPPKEESLPRQEEAPATPKPSSESAGTRGKPPQNPWRSSSRTSGAGFRWCRPASTSAGRSSARMARPRC